MLNTKTKRSIHTTTFNEKQVEKSKITKTLKTTSLLQEKSKINDLNIIKNCSKLIT